MDSLSGSLDLPESHPLWVRGLKYTVSNQFPLNPSHPLWVRGLKYDSDDEEGNPTCVAPFMGAWIEITVIEIVKLLKCVAPFMGAWIEMPIPHSSSKSAASSHPLWVRGLKSKRTRLRD